MAEIRNLGGLRGVLSIVVTGSVAYDYIMSFPGHFKEHILPDKIDILSVSFLVDSLKRQRGGCATNIAYNLALAGRAADHHGHGRRGLWRLPGMAGGARRGHLGCPGDQGRLHRQLLRQHRPAGQPDRQLLHRRHEQGRLPQLSRLRSRRHQDRHHLAERSRPP